MFIGRERELKSLEQLYASNKFEFVVLYGRRRVGKTALLTQFIQDKKAIYFMGVESNAKQNLENLSMSILEYASGIAAETSFVSFQAALEYVFKLAKKDRIVLVLDEYPYVARSSKSLASTLQILIDKNKDTSKLMLILCGSSMSYMEGQVLAYKTPLYGRRTAQMKLLPFDFEESCCYFSHFQGEDKALAYGIVGGTPQYLLQINDKLSIEENIKNTFLNPISFFYEEPVNLLKQEVREPAIYTAIITAIAAGASRMSEISSKLGEDTNVCASYIKNLISLGIVRKETPCGEKPSRKSLYSIEDNMLDGTMFSTLLEYQDKNYFLSHPEIDFNTLYQEEKYAIISVFYWVYDQKNSSPDLYYNFIDAKDPADFDRFIALVKELSFYDTGVSASYGDELLTLITCWDYQGNGRMNIVAKKIELSIRP